MVPDRFYKSFMVGVDGVFLQLESCSFVFTFQGGVYYCADYYRGGTEDFLEAAGFNGQ